MKTERSFFDLWSKKESDALTRRLAFFCAQRSGEHEDLLSANIYLNNFQNLCSFSIDYSESTNPRDLMYARQALAFYSKDADVRLCDTEQAAFDTFVECEQKCKTFNEIWYQKFASSETDDETEFFYSVSRKIADILGPCPELKDLKFEFGPGSSTNVKQKTTARHKLEAQKQCSHGLKDSIDSILSVEVPHYHYLHPEDVCSVDGRLAMVPKKATTDRTIMIEPTLNTPFQKGIGSFIRSRLKLFGCNLKSQERNRELALLGSVSGIVGTMDVKNASDTIALYVVYILLSFSPDWFDLLWKFRTGEVEYKGKRIILEKFSSMGNGFTFELESLIFYAIAMTVCERSSSDTSLVSVYGDDIIVPVDIYDDLVEKLSFCGFSVNSDKSYKEGGFRESCGVDYYFGRNIRPFYKKDRWTNARLVGLLNFDLRHNNLLYDLRFDLIHSFRLLESVNFGPDGYGDCVLLTDDLDVPIYHKKQPRISGFTAVTKEQLDSNSWPVLSPKRKIRCKGRPSSFFIATVQTPKVCTKPLEIGDQLIPLYNASLFSKLESETRFMSGWKWDGEIYVWCAEQVPIEYYINPIDYQTADDRYLLVDRRTDRGLRDVDPFSIRGGWKERKVNVYII